MNINDEQANYCMKEAELTFFVAKTIFERAETEDKPVWANIVKNGYDAMENAIVACIAKKGEIIPRESHPEKLTRFADLYQSESVEINKIMSYWITKRSRAQYVDIKDNKVLVPYLFFSKEDAIKILKDAEIVIKLAKQLMENQK